MRKPPAAHEDERLWELSPDETAAYYRVISTHVPLADRIDDRVWLDLELDRAFARLDRAATPLGSQFLYALLRLYQTRPSVLQENIRLYQEFAARPEARAAVVEAMRGLDHAESSALAEFLSGAMPSLPRYHRLFLGPAAASILCTIGLLFSHWFIWPLIALWITNLILQWTFGRKLSRYGPALKNIAVMLGCVPRLIQALASSELAPARDLRSFAGLAGQLRRKVALTLLRGIQGNDLALALVEYLNLLCLFELCFFSQALERLQDHRAALGQLFALIARIDASQGLAAALQSYPHWCLPESQSARGFRFEAVYHPLVPAPVYNTMATSGKSLLLSGPNMAGKTTFIKTLGINLVLAQTLGLCLARRALLPLARVQTILDRQESVQDGQSYFLREASALLAMLRASEQADRPCWFLIDEPFRGTNSLERIAAAQAILGYLDGRWLVIASTHDYELFEFLADRFEAGHFGESIDGGGARFDYLFRPGPCTSRNAIQLLTLAGYPREVTDSAAAAVEAQRSRMPLLSSLPKEGARP
ncbi:MAG: hypothetical protein U1G07_08135 [Verrucomicrobiota bacterium]